MKLRARLVAASLIMLLGAAAGGESFAAKPDRGGGSAPPRPKVLVLHDSGGPYGTLGEVYALMLRNLLGHFEVDVVVRPVTQYAAIRSETHLQTFYVGSTYDEPMTWQVGTPERSSWDAFASDVATGSRSAVWMGHNLWHVAWLWKPEWGASFASRFGFDFTQVDEASQYNRVTYKGVELDKGVVRHVQPGAAIGGCAPETATGFYDCNVTLGVTTVVDASKASVLATARSTVTGVANPYVVRGGSLWYVGDIPFDYVSEEDRYLAIADLLHDMLGIAHAEEHRALVRLEDVSAGTPTQGLLATESVLDAAGVPFAIAAIPFYKDPYGYYTGGTPEDYPLGRSSTGEVVKRLALEGANVVQHGTTHQLDSTANPYNAVTGDDFEFYRVTENADASLSFVGPVPGDSSRWATDRMERGRRELRAMKLSAFAWEAPHYTASAVDYSAIKSMYPIQYSRAMYWTSAGRSFGQFYPYVVTDSYGYKVVPENLGDISPDSWRGYAASLPSDLVRKARAAKVVRDGFASFYFHPYLDPALLQQTIDGIRALGFRFVQACSVVGACAQ